MSAKVAAQRKPRPPKPGSIVLMRYDLTTSTVAAARIFFPRSVLMLSGLLVWMIAGAAAARAETCGHYLFRNGQPVSHASTAAADHAAQAAATRHAEQYPLLPRLPRLPCSGPGCQKQSAPMMPAPAAPSASAERDPAAILNALLSTAGNSGSSCAPQSERGEVRLPAKIFRPPAA